MKDYPFQSYESCHKKLEFVLDLVNNNSYNLWNQFLPKIIGQISPYGDNYNILYWTFEGEKLPLNCEQTQKRSLKMLELFKSLDKEERVCRELIKLLVNGKYITENQGPRPRIIGGYK